MNWEINIRKKKFENWFFLLLLLHTQKHEDKILIYHTENKSTLWSTESTHHRNYCEEKNMLRSAFQFFIFFNRCCCCCCCDWQSNVMIIIHIIIIMMNTKQNKTKNFDKTKTKNNDNNIRSNLFEAPLQKKENIRFYFEPNESNEWK